MNLKNPERQKKDVNKSALHKDAFKSDFQKKFSKSKTLVKRITSATILSVTPCKTRSGREEKKGLNQKIKSMIKDLANVLSEKRLEELN